MTLSDALKRTYSSVGTDVVFETLELNHFSFPQTFRIVRDYVPLTAGLENGGGTVTFEPFAFNVVQPKKNDKGSETLQIVIDNVDRRIVDLVEGAIEGVGAKTPIDVIYRIYLTSQTTIPQNDPPLRLSLFNITINKGQMSGTAKRDDIINRKFPNVVYGREFISLFSQ